MPRGQESPRYVARIISLYGDDRSLLEAQINQIKQKTILFSGDTPLYFTTRYSDTKKRSPDLKKSAHVLKLVVIEPYGGKNLFDYLKANFSDFYTKPCLTVNEAFQRLQLFLKLGSAICKAIHEQVHQKGYVHWDIREENLLVEETQDPVNPFKIRVIDFQGAVKAGEATKVTTYTPDHCAPEVIDADKKQEKIIPDSNQDVFSVGKILVPMFEVITGRLGLKVLNQHFASRRDPALFNLYQCNLRLCSKDPKQRPCLPEVIKAYGNAYKQMDEINLKNQAATEMKSPTLFQTENTTVPKKCDDLYENPHFQQLNQYVATLEKEIEQIKNLSKLSYCQYFKKRSIMFFKGGISLTRELEIKQAKITTMNAGIKDLKDSLSKQGKDFNVANCVQQIRGRFPVLTQHTKGFSSRAETVLSKIAQSYSS